MSRLDAARTTLPEARIYLRHYSDVDGSSEIVDCLVEMAYAFSGKKRPPKPPPPSVRSADGRKETPPRADHLTDTDKRRLARSGGIILPPARSPVNPG